LKVPLKEFFEPRGVALVGATRTPGFGYGIPLMLKRQGWGDRLYLVNPSARELHGMKVYPRVAEVPDPVDLAVVIVSAALVPAALNEIGARGIRSVVIESAGFAEAGDEGRALQEQALSAARQRGIRVIGPNCVGVVNTKNRFTTVEIIEEALQPGPLAIIAQSGVFGNVLLDGLYERGLFVSKAVTMGNRMDVNECDVLDFLHADPDTRLVIMYLEGAADGPRLLTTLARVTRDKPVLVLKSGRTGAGRAATASHTGSMSGEDAIYDAAFVQSGAIRAQSLEELLGMARVFSAGVMPQGNRLGILTTSGSLGALAADVAVANGLSLPPLSETTVEKMRQGAPGWMNVKNPLDLGPSGLYQKGLAAIMQDPAIDMVLAIAIIPFAVVRQLKPLGLTPKAWFGDVPNLRALAPSKPFVLCAVGNSEFIADMSTLSGPAIPLFTSPEPAAKALAAIWRYQKRMDVSV
jgi:acetyltransferase